MRFLALTEGMPCIVRKAGHSSQLFGRYCFQRWEWGEDFTDLYLRTDKAMYIASERVRAVIAGHGANNCYVRLDC